MDRTVTSSGIWLLAELDDVQCWLYEHLESLGYTVAAEAADDDRVITLTVLGRWIRLNDSDVSGDVAGLDALARALSELGPALATDVVDSEVGAFVAWQDRRRLGGVSLPEAARLHRGALRLRLPWLAPLSPDPMLLHEGLSAGSSRVEEQLAAVLAHLGVPAHDDPGPPTAQLCWHRPVQVAVPAQQLGPPVLELRQHPLPELMVGVPLPEQLALQVRQVDGAPSRGLSLSLCGDVAALGLEGLVGWQGAAPGRQPEPVAAELIDGKVRFDDVTLEVFTWPDMDAEVPTGRQLQRYRLAMDRQERVQWMMHLIGRPREAGVHEVEVEARAGTGASLRKRLSFTVLPAPRVPVLPEPPPSDSLTARLQAAHDGAEYAVGRLVWRSWKPALTPWLLRQLSTLAHWVGQGPEVLWRHRGEHPRPPGLPIAGPAWEALFHQLAEEGQLRLGLEGWLQLSHGEDRVELLFALPDPGTPFGRARITAVLTRLLEQAAGGPVAAVVSTAGAPWQVHAAPPWWVLAGRAGHWCDLDWLVANGLGPGWRVRRADGSIWSDGTAGLFDRDVAAKERAEREALSRSG